MSAKPPPLKITINPATGKTKKLTYDQLRGLWIQAGGSPALASRMAAVARAETNGDPGDPWHIAYYQTQRGGKAVTFPTALAATKAAVSAAAQNGLDFWTTYGGGTGAYTAFYKPTTPEEKAQASVQQSTVTATTQSKSQKYQEAQAHEAQVAADAHIQGNIEVETATREAKATAHITDPWVTVNRNKNGAIIGYGEAYGAAPPKNALTIGGQPATKSLYQSVWSNTYDTTFQAYTGRIPSPAEQVSILERGVSLYTLRDELSKKQGFTKSPIYEQTASGREQQAKDTLGVAASPDLIRRSIAQDWDAATFAAHLRAQPQYEKGPAFRNNIAANQTTYQGIYGNPDPEAKAWLKHVTLQGWSPDAVGQALRSDKAYKYSPEYQAKAVSFLDQLGVITGTQPVVAPSTTPAAVKQQTAGSRVGGAPTALTVSTVGG